MELLFMGLAAGAVLSYFIFSKFATRSKQQRANQQSIILLEKIKRVSKLISVEGEFAEIYHHENTKEKLLGLISSKKKAIVIINAKVHIGFDFTKIQMESDLEEKCIRLLAFPEPEIISVEPTLRYYDIQNGLLNKFNSDDLTAVNAAAKEHIINKVPDSNLIPMANTEALQALHVLNNLAETIGWRLDISALELPNHTQKKLTTS